MVNFGHDKLWIRIHIDLLGRIRILICMDLKSWIWVSIETNSDPKHMKKTKSFCCFKELPMTLLLETWRLILESRTP